MTEREKVLLKREGFVEGRVAAAVSYMGSAGGRSAMEVYEDEAAKRFPLPKVTRRRVVDLGKGWTYRVSEDGLALESSWHGAPWVVSHTLSSLTALLELMSNPDEEVEE